MGTPQTVGTIAARRILVVAPHPDDEALGCGGLIALLSKLGRRFHTVFVTDGGASHPASASWTRRRIAARRETEAVRSLALLGVGDQARTFLRLPDAAMPPLAAPAGQRALAALAEIVRSFAPELVLLPWRRDPHCDHRDAWALTRAALRLAGIKPDALEYAVWLDEFGALEDHPQAGEAERVAFDVSEAMAAKRAAVMAHASQTTDLIDDDPTAFRLSPATIARLCGPTESYWRPWR